MSDFLNEMIAASTRRAAAAQLSRPLELPDDPGPRGRLRRALNAYVVGHDGHGSHRGHEAASSAPLAIIAEVKRHSPSRGAIAPDLDAVAQARAYEAAGADAVSVLTEPDRFGGSLDDLRAVTAAIDIPVIRKDFLVDRYQVREAAAAGASAVLLIAAALPDAALGALLDECHDCGVDALVEVHDAQDLKHAYKAGATLIGINNRDLRTLQVDLGTTERLAALVGRCTLLVAESGIATAADARRMQAAGAQAILVGEALVRSDRGRLRETLAALRGAGGGAPAGSPAPAPEVTR